MRRAAAVVVLGAMWLILLADSAAAHPGIENPYIPVHRVATIALGVPSEQPSPMVEIDVSLPPDFTLQRVDSVPDWQEVTTPGRLRYFDGNVPQGGYAQFTFSGVFATKGVVELPVVTRAADGTTVTWDQPPTGRLPAAVAFPGYPEGSAPAPGAAVAGTSGGGGLSPFIPVAAVAVLGGAAWFGVTVLRRRRQSVLLGQLAVVKRPPADQEGAADQEG